MKSLKMVLLIFLTLAGVKVESNRNNTDIPDTNKRSNTYNVSSSFTQNSFSTNIYKFNSSIVGDSSPSATFRDKRDTNFALDQSEIARQNQITEQILSNYLQRRLFPLRSVNQKIPTIAEILPKPKSLTARPRARGFAASSSSYKKGAGKHQQRRTYGNRQKNRNSLPKQKATEKPHLEDDYEEVKAEKSTTIKSSYKRENNSNNDSVNNDFVDEAVVEDIEEEGAAEEELETQQLQQQNYQHHLLRHRYRYLEGVDNPEADGQESLQSVESEQHDHYYSNNGNSGDIFSTDPRENEIDSANSKLEHNSSNYTNLILGTPVG